MSLSSLLASGAKTDKVMAIYSALDESEQDAFRVLVKDPLWTGPQIATALRLMGHDITGDQIRRFRGKLREGKVSL